MRGLIASIFQIILQLDAIFGHLSEILESDFGYHHVGSALVEVAIFRIR